MNHDELFTHPPRAELTDDMRAWIRQYPRTGLLWDFCREFQARHNLTPDESSTVLAQWIRECC